MWDTTQLVQRAREGDAQAFAALARRHQPRALSDATALLGDADLAQDVVQEALAIAHARIDTLTASCKWSSLRVAPASRQAPRSWS